MNNVIKVFETEEIGLLTDMEISLFFRNHGRFPKVAYLGHEEYDKLRTTKKCTCIFTEKTHEVYYKNIRIFRVYEKNHFEMF